MRMPFAKKALAGALTLLTAASTGSAQTGRASLGPGDLGTPQWADAPMAGPYGPGPGPYGPGGGYDAGPIGVPGAMFQPQYGTMPPQALYPPQAPSTMNPWPEISPFHPPNVAYTQHQNKGGLWFRKQVHRKTDYEFGVDYILTSFKEPRDRTVGSNYQPMMLIDGELLPIGQTVPTYGVGPAQEITLVSSTFPGANPLAVMPDGATNIDYVEDGRFFPIMSTGAIAGGLDSDGVKLHWGVTHEDGTGWRASGFWASEVDAGYGRGTENVYDVPITQNVILSNPDLLFTLVGGLPLIFSNDLYGSDGNTPGYLGDTQKFDVLYRLDYSTFAGGAQLNRLGGLLHDGNFFKVSSLYGARYLYLDENFKFHGIDSGFGYDFEENGDDNIEFGRPDNLALVDRRYPLLHARLNSTVQSHIAGPQIGFRVDIGNKGAFHLWTETIGGILANYETLEVNGNNIGVATLRPDMHDGTQFLDNSFRDRDRHTHVSPLFEQSVYADIRMQSVIPILRKSYMLEEARFRVGYTFTWIGEVSRPGDSINWAGFPMTPSVTVNRDNFTMSQLSLGLTIPY